MTLLDVLAEAAGLGLLGPGPVEPHVRHAHGLGAVAEQAVGVPSLAVDLGSGGGVPALVLAERWPASRWVLVEAADRRAAFLGAACEALGLSDRVSVRRERAETVGRDATVRATFELVTARSFGPPAVVAECAAPLLRVGGALVVSEPPGGELERWPEAGTAGVGLGPAELCLVDGAGYAVMRQTTRCDGRFPRRVGIPSKRPLF